MACRGKLVAALENVASFAVWTGPSNALRDPPWHSDLSTTRIAFAFALAYDMLYPSLSDDERSIIAGALIEKGIKPLLDDWVLPGTRVHALDSMGHNWWAVCIGLAGVALLPVADLVPQAEEWFAAIDEALGEFVDYAGAPLHGKVPNFDDKGLFYESVGYFNYGAGELMRYIWHAERCRGAACAARRPLMDKFGDAVMALSYPADGGLKFLNFGDSSTDTSVTFLAKYLILCGYSSPALFECLRRSRREDDLADLFHGGALTGRVGGFGSLPKLAAFEKTGYAIWRSSWEDGATLFAVKSGFTWNHAHEDAGSFVLYAGGEPLFTDSGSCPYGDKLYQEYYVRGEAHNLVLLGGKNQPPENIYRGCKFPGSILFAEQLFAECPTPGVAVICADATGPVANLCARNYRSFVILDNRTFVIFDDIYTHEPCSAESLYHFDGGAEARDGALHIHGECASARVIPILPEAAEISFRDGWLEQKRPARYAAITAPGEAKARLLVTVVTLDGSASVSRISGGDWEGVALTGGTEARVCFNLRADGRRMHVNSNNNIDGIDTDAYLTVQKDNRLFCVWASYVRAGGKSLFESYVKRNAFCELKD